LDLEIGAEVCATREIAETRLSEQRFDAVLVDFDGQSDAAREVLRKARHTSLNHNTLAIAIAGTSVNVREVFALGSNFVLYKPISEDRATTSLRAARSLMGRERRRSVRIPLHARATLDFNNVENAKATLIDLSDSGTAIQSEQRLPTTCKVYFKFTLPEQTALVRLSAEVVWQDSAGRVGLRFVDVPQSSRRLIQDWLSKAFEDANTFSKMMAKTPLVAAPARPAAGRGEQRAARPVGLAATLAAASGNRRNQSRKPCRLGAEVFRVETPIPHRCSVTDIGPGGCYVEMPTPFALQTQVEVQIRTRELKARFPGTVQAVHPGFGMGVRFGSLSEQQQQDLQVVLRDVAASNYGLEMGSTPWLV
jgi:hypothetical protein